MPVLLDANTGALIQKNTIISDTQTNPNSRDITTAEMLEIYNAENNNSLFS